MHTSASVRRWARILQVLSLAAIVLLCLVLALAVILPELPDELRAVAGLAPDIRLSLPHRLAIAAIGVIPGLAMVFVLTQVHGLFALYAAGETLSFACASRIRRIGLGLLAVGGLGIFTHPLQTVLASLPNPPGGRVLAIELASPDLGMLLAGGLMTVIGWVMADAAHIAEENRGFI